MTKKVDPRIVRTRNRLRGAMLDLLIEKTYTDITVNDLTKQAGLNRATFYLHYEGKESLLLDALDAHFQGLMDAIDTRLGGDTHFIHNTLPEEMTFEFVAQNEPLFRVLLSPTGPGFAMQKMIDAIAQFGGQRVALQFPGAQDAAYYDMMSHHVAGGLFALLRWWLQNDMPRPPAEMAQFAQDLVNDGTMSMIQRMAEGRVLGEVEGS